MLYSTAANEGADKGMTELVIAMKTYTIMLHKSVTRRLRKIAKRNCELRHVRPSVRMEQLRSNLRNFHKI
jgi:hypothetical protein